MSDEIGSEEGPTADEDLRESRDDARRMLDHLLVDLPGVVYRCRNDENWTMIGVTPNVEELTGYPPSALIRDGDLEFGDLIHLDDRERVWERVQEAVDRDESFRITYRIHTRSGEERWVLEQGRAVEDRKTGEVVLTGYIQDLTEPVGGILAQQQEELDESRRQRRLIELLQTVTSTVNEHRSLETALRSAIPEICTALGFEVGHVFLSESHDGSELRSTDIWHLDAAGAEAFREATERNEWSTDEGLPGRVMKSGAPEWIEDVKRDPTFFRVGEDDPSPIRSGLGAPIVSGTRPLGVLEIYSVEHRSPQPDVAAILRQIGVQVGRVWEREEAEARLRESEARFRQIAELIDDVFWISSPDKKTMEYVSPAYRKVWGREPEELYRDPGSWVRAIHPEDRERIRVTLPTQATGEYEEEYRIVRPDGAVRWIWDRAFPVEGADGTVRRVVGVAEDVTERKELEWQLTQAQKMEAVGRLAGGIAHDFNNILTVISAQSDLLLLDLESTALKEEVELIRNSAERAARLTSQLLAFSREQVLRPRVVDLNETIAGMEHLLRRVLGEDIRIRIRLGEPLPPVRVDVGQLEQVIMNLVINARDAMPGGGALEISTRKEFLDSDEAAERRGLWPGPNVCLRVSDTGMGMHEEIRSRVFEPFFTTKRDEGGTGLGLAVSYGIVKQSGGAIHVDSEPGKGTTFKIRFPAAEDEAPVADPSVGDREQDRPGTGTVLAIEDDPSVRRIVRRILERAGIELKLAGDAETGLEILEESGADIEVVLTDLVLPGMSGRDLLEKIREGDLDLRVVVMSGYDRDSPGSRGDLPTDVLFIQKPFSPDELLEVLRAALAGDSPSKG